MSWLLAFLGELLCPQHGLLAPQAAIFVLGGFQAAGTWFRAIKHKLGATRHERGR